MSGSPFCICRGFDLRRWTDRHYAATITKYNLQDLESAKHLCPKLYFEPRGSSEEEVRSCGADEAARGARPVLCPRHLSLSARAPAACACRRVAGARSIMPVGPVVPSASWPVPPPRRLWLACSLAPSSSFSLCVQGRPAALEGRHAMQRRIPPPSSLQS